MPRSQPKKVGLAHGYLDGDEVVVTEVVLGSEVESVVETIVSWSVGRRVLGRGEHRNGRRRQAAPGSLHAQGGPEPESLRTANDGGAASGR